ncbi:zinc finger Y-chromosomal protein 1-like [Epargyreus clarus]|uniref:zinc finger Y-chromosomal protein 1-like n=1 Tax=Epargyreus clarus TaxID=520877 RepID=UPI003C2C8630
MTTNNAQADPSKICRVCLEMNVKMYSFSQNEYKKQYEEVTGLSISNKDKLPQDICWECAHRLSACYKFRAKAVLSHCLMTGLLETEKRITKTNVRKINRYKNGLQSQLVQYKVGANYIDIKLQELVVDNKTQLQEIVNNTKRKRKTEEIQFEEIEIDLKCETFKTEDEGIDDKDSDNSHDSDDLKPILQISKEKNDSTAMKKNVKTKKVKITRERQRLHSSLVVNVNYFNIIDLSIEEQKMEIEKRKESDNYLNSEYKCDKCFKGFLDEAAFKLHSIRHTNQSGDFECEVCKIHFRNVYAMRHHAVSHVQKFSCKRCPYVTTTRGAAKLHEKFHEGTVYQCPHCQENFNKYSTYMSHVRIKHPSDIVCDLCGNSFVSHKGLDLHKKLKHRFDETIITEEVYSCEPCDLRFVTAEALQTHLKVSAKHKVDQPKEEGVVRRRTRTREPGAKLSARYRPRRKPAEPIHCEQCDIQLADAIAYYRHFRRAHPDKNRTNFPSMRAKSMCEVCGRMFQSLALLQDHKSTHALEKQFKCAHCDKSFQRKYRLIAHTRMHTEAKSVHCCSICGKGFSSTSNMQRHMFSHTGLKPYKCEMCGKCFKHVGEKRIHITYVHLKKPWPKRSRGKRTNKVVNDLAQESETSNASIITQPLWPVCNDPKIDFL